jgi:hypothetical protein
MAENTENRAYAIAIFVTFIANWAFIEGFATLLDVAI